MKLHMLFTFSKFILINQEIYSSVCVLLGLKRKTAVSR